MKLDEHLNPNDINLDDYNYIPTVKHRDLILKLAKEFYEIEQINDIGTVIIANNGERAWLGSKPYSAIEYVLKGLDRSDNVFLPDFHKNKTVTLYEPERKLDLIDTMVQDFAISHADVHRVYTLIRRCSDCTMLATVGMPRPIDKPQKFYDATVDRLELFLCHYFDETLFVFLENLPQLKNSRFATDKDFRDNVIKNRILPIKAKLTPRECELLYLASLGKTAAESATIMGISENTVIGYRKEVTRKLNAANLLHATKLAQIQGFIS